MSGQKYRCYGKTLYPPEDGDLTCASQSWIVKEKVKCKVSCARGKPTHEVVECKLNVGWRPTHKVSCEGVGPGVIIGVLLGGLAAVIIIAIAYAKFKQYQKKKYLKKNPPPPKVNTRRPGTADQRPGKKLITGVENDRGHVPTGVINKAYNQTPTGSLPNSYQPSERESIPSSMSSPRGERDIPPKPGPRQQQQGDSMHRMKSKDPGVNYYHPQSAIRPPKQGYGAQGAYYEDNVTLHTGGHNSMPPAQYVGYDGYEQQHPSTSGYGSMRGYDDYRSMPRPPTNRAAHYGGRPYDVQT